MTKRIFTFSLLWAGLLLPAGYSGAQEIFDAIKGGDLAKVKAVVEKDPRTLDSSNGYAQTPLVVALQGRKAEIAEFLIARGADVNARDNAHASPLSFAITGGLNKIAGMLIDRNADIDTPALWDLRPGARSVPLISTTVDRRILAPQGRKTAYSFGLRSSIKSALRQ